MHGETLGRRYRALEVLGSGGGGTTARVFDRVLAREVALKRLMTAEASRTREIELLARVLHPRLPRILEWGRAPDGGAFYTSELIEGEDLGARAQPWEVLETALLDVLEALLYLHRRRLRHGDVKAANVRLRRDGRAVLLDLGCAAAFGPVDEVSGTLDHLAPEVTHMQSADGRADLFAFARMLERLERTCGAAPERWSAARAGLAEDPAERPASVESLLERLGAPERLRARPSAECARLLGRDAERASLAAHVRELHDSREGPRLVRLLGEPGSGRTRMLRALAHDAAARGPVRWAPTGASAPLRQLGAQSSDAVEFEGAPLSIEEALGLLDEARMAPPQVWLVDDLERWPERSARALRALVSEQRVSDPLLIVVAGSIEGPAACSVELGALSRRACDAWASGRIDEGELAALHEASGGHPATIRAILAQRIAGVPMGAAVSSRDVGSLRPSEREVVATLAAAGRPLAPERLDDVALAAVHSLGWTRLREGRVELARAADAGPALTSVDAATLAAIHRALAAEALHPADRIRHEAGAGELASALPEVPPETDAKWRSAADALAAAPAPGPRVAARWMLAQGRPEEALRTLGALEVSDAERRSLSALCLLRLERLPEAEEALGPRDEAEPADLTDVRCRVAIKRGQYAEARRWAERALVRTDLEPRIRAHLLEDVGVAASYLSDRDAAAALEQAASALSESDADVRHSVRVLSYLGIDAFRRGDLGAAGAAYARARDAATAARLDDQLGAALLNLGTVSHQAGRYGEALAAYDRALRLASALGQTATVATLEFDRAQLYADVGALDRSAAIESRAAALASAGGFGLLLGACATVRARIGLHGADVEGAREAIAEAAAAFEEAGATRERDEVRVLEGELALLEGSRSEARAAVASIDAGEARDVAVRLALVLGRASETIGERRAHFERAAREAAEAGFGALEADALCRLADAWSADGGHTLAARHMSAAREIWERQAAQLPESIRAAFWAHPDRRHGAAEAERAVGPSSDRERQLERLLALNRFLGSSLDVDDVLHQAMDAAIELTGAERGFLLLRDDSGALGVEVARNIDRERVGKSHLKFSRSIAERAIERGEPVVTVDARADDRFASHESVHAMKLRSVVAVPIPSPEGVVGALYLDNRFARARFATVDAGLLMAFADQVAIALRNARMHSMLRRRTEELERERERVEQLSRGQAREIERLHAELAERQDELVRRYDYGALIARSPAMQPVLATLDRVIDSPLSVLVVGESGVGKELVARAVHFNGPRAEGPFVAVNCAALPDALLESELFGHVRGAFTGAERDRAGLMRAAAGGTLFLDEVGETSLVMQAKLLRALEQREVRPVGGGRAEPVDFRLVCATNRDLRERATEGAFREDLYYRIGVVEVRVPPLRERLEDLPELSRLILERAAEEMDRAVPALSAAALEHLLAQPWPGNVRQLANALRAALVMARDETLEPAHFALATAPRLVRPASSRAERDAAEKARILAALRATDWNVTRAAQRAGVGRATMYRKLRKYGLR